MEMDPRLHPADKVEEEDHKKNLHPYLMHIFYVIPNKSFKIKENPMKKILVVAIAFVLALTAVVPAFAAGGPRGSFTLIATISAIDPVSGAVTVSVMKGNALAKSYIGQSVVLTTTAQTRYLYKSSPTAVPALIPFADLKVGNAVSVNGTLANGVWTTTRITVGAKLTCLP